MTNCRTAWHSLNNNNHSNSSSQQALSTTKCQDTLNSAGGSARTVSQSVPTPTRRLAHTWRLTSPSISGMEWMTVASVEKPQSLVHLSRKSCFMHLTSPPQVGKHLSLMCTARLATPRRPPVILGSEDSPSTVYNPPRKVSGSEVKA